MASVLVTGSSKGIGFETALAFARAGHSVFAGMRNPAQAPQLAEAAASEKLPITILTMDVDSDESVCDAVAAVLSQGPLEVLVNNAGIERAGSVEELPLAEFRAVMETNYFGVLRCIQAVIPSMRRRQSGRIVNVSSVAGKISNPPMTAYSASKWALEALCEGAAAELKPFGIRVTLVEPGIIDTSMARRIGDVQARSDYPHLARFSAFFATALQHPVPASLVAQKILDVATGDSWQLRHPVGPDSVPLLQWRARMTDEQWIDLNAADTETWTRSLQREFGPHAQSASD